MGNDITILEQNKNHLTATLENNKKLVEILDLSVQDEFKSNFLELASNDYLISAVIPDLLVKFAIDITKLGLNINPAYKEVYIVPYNTQLRKNTPHIMLPQAIIPLNGMQERANKQGFFLRLYEVYNFDGDIVSEKEMQRKHQIQMDTTNQQWFNDHFVGFDVLLQDLTGQIPDQIKFVEKKYLEFVTDKLKSPSYKAQTWRHKAARRAFGDFNIPRARNLDVLEKLDYINNQVLENDKPDINPKSLEQLGIKTIRKDGFLIAQGNTYGKTDYLKQMGFKFHGGNWVKEAVFSTMDAEVITQPQNNATLKDVKKELFKLFKEFGLPLNRQKEFVVDYLGLNGSDMQGMQEVISKKEELKTSIDGFLAEPVLEHVS